MVLGGQPTSFFFYNRIREKQFFTLPVVNDNEIVRNTSGVVEGKAGLINLFGVLHSKLLVPTCIAISGYAWQWVETKRRWLATQDLASNPDPGRADRSDKGLGLGLDKKKHRKIAVQSFP